MMKRTFICVLVFLLSGLSGVTIAQRSFTRIFPDAAPDTEGRPNRETLDTGRIQNVFQPEIMGFIPDAPDPRRPCILICPGGGYRRLAIEKEGYKVAAALNRMGIQAWVLKYRLHPDEALRDIQRAVSFLRYHAAQYGLSGTNIGVLGFSAGGHLAVNLVSNPPPAQNADAIDTVSCVPDFVASIYGLLEPRNGRADSLLHKYNLSGSVNINTPPVFLVHAIDDPVVPVEYTERYYRALRACNIATELHLYAKGGHGFGIEADRGEVSKWIQVFRSWMIERGHLTRP